MNGAKQQFFDTYWDVQDPARVSRRAAWRAMQLYMLVGNHYHCLLDIGAGQGELLHYFRAAGYEVEGWDVSPRAVARLIEGGYFARQVDIEEDDFDGEFDLIACCEVLQQAHDSASVLQKIKGVLAKDGRLFLTLPNEFHLLRQLGIGKPAGSHLVLFSPRRARELIKANGFVTVAKVYQPLVPPRWKRIWRVIGQWAADTMPSLFCLSVLLLVKRKDDN